jgi:ABC-type transport system involved in multi-copper enzyme maturation permease subunit
VSQPPATHPPPTARPKPVKKPPRAGVVGPLFVWELLRLARRGQDARGRLILAVALFLILTAFSLIWFRNTSAVDLFFGGAQSLTVQESANFGTSFSLAFVFGQLTILCLLTPAYAAGGFAEEKDKQTLVYLLVSDLTEREIVFGKFLGRTVFLLGILFAGLPILAITQLHGGVSQNFLLLSYLNTATTVVLLSAVSAYAAAAAETYRGGLFRAYGFTALIVIAGCGIMWASPYWVVAFLFLGEGDDPRMFWAVGLGYPLAELALTGFAVWMAMRAVRRMRARLVRSTPKPPPWVRDRYRDEDDEKAWQEERRRKREEMKRLLAVAGPPIELVPDEEPPAPPVPSTSGDGQPPRLKARRVVVATPLPKQDLTPRPPLQRGEGEWRTPSAPEGVASGASRGRSSTRYRDPAVHAAKEWTPRPRVGNGDPFEWKERHTSGAVRTEDDEAMRSMMYLIGGALALVVVFFGMIAVIAVLTGNDSGRSFARTLLLVAGGAGVFAHLLQIGLSACATVCRERQRLTLESLLTIPVDRAEILWPKWKASLLRGWWWGGPAAAVLVFAFATTDAPLAIPLAAAVLAAMWPLAAGYGVWLSIRCSSVNRAVMWYLPLAGFLVVFPVAVCAWVTAETAGLWCAVLGVGAAAAGVAAWAFWRAGSRAFEIETVLGPGRK